MILRGADVVFEGHPGRAFKQMLTSDLQGGEIRQFLIGHRQAGLLPDMLNPGFFVAPLAELGFDIKLCRHFPQPLVVRPPFKFRLNQFFRENQIACRSPGFADVPALHKAGFWQQQIGIFRAGGHKQIACHDELNF